MNQRINSATDFQPARNAGTDTCTNTQNSKTSSASAKGSFLVVCAGIFWGTMGIFVRPFTAFGLSSIDIAAIRLVLTALIFALILTVHNPADWRIKLSDLPLFLGLGVVSIALFTACYFTAIQMMELSTAAILLYTSPIWVMLMSIIFFKEKITTRKLVALGLAFLGCILVSGIGGSVTLVGFAIGISSGIGYALYSILGTITLRRYSSLTVTTYSMIFAGITTLLISNTSKLAALLSNPTSILATTVSTGASFTDAIANMLTSTPAIIVFALLMALITGVIPYLLYTLGLERVKASHAAIIATVEPISATLIGTFLLGEPLTLLSLAGIICVLGAIAVLNTSSKPASL